MKKRTTRPQKKPPTLRQLCERRIRRGAKGRSQRTGGQLVRGSAECVPSRKSRKALIAAKVQERKNEKKNPAVEAIEKTLDATNAEQMAVPEQEQKCDYSEDEVAAMFTNGGE